FVASQPRNVRIGLVEFSGNAMIAQMPTLARDELQTALDHLYLQRGTAVGSGIIASLQAIFPDMQSEISLSSLSSRGPPDPQAAPLGGRQEPKETKAPILPVKPGSYASAVI